MMLLIIIYLESDVYVKYYSSHINSIVISRIDYCSSLLCNIRILQDPAYSIAPLNRIIRSSIQSIFNIKLSDHSITDSFKLLPNWFTYKKDP